MTEEHQRVKITLLHLRVLKSVLGSLKHKYIDGFIKNQRIKSSLTLELKMISSVECFSVFCCNVPCCIFFFLLTQMFLTVYLSNSDKHFTELPITPETLCRDVVDMCKEPGEVDCYLAEMWRGSGMCCLAFLCFLFLLSKFIPK